MKINKSLLSLIPLTAVAVTTITSVFAWYVSTIGITQDLSDGKLAANASYFESGDGSKDSPFIISNARHLYNLAWLQDLGHFDDKVYYFELKNDIDMSQLKVGSNSASPIPAIGIDDHPFIGSFNGNGHTINNLFVATSFSSDTCIKPSQDVLNSHNQEQTKKTYNTTTNTIISSYNGLFGVIKKYNDSSDSDSQVTNFTIANAKIESSQNTLVGYICGYVNSDLSHVGVASSNLTIGSGVTHITTTSTTYPISHYGIVGDYNNASGGIQWEQSGGDIGYGTSTDIRALYDEMIRLNLVAKGTGTIPKYTALPFKCSNDTSLSERDGQSTIYTYGANRDISYSSSIAVAEGATNIGYYSGAEIKTYKDLFAKTKASDSYKIDYDKLTQASNYLGEKNNVTLDESVKEYLTTNIDELTRNGDSALVLSGQCYLDGSVLSNADNYNLIKNGKVGTYTGDVLIPYRSIWVAPIQPGKFQMVFVNRDSKTARVNIWKIKRMEPGNYSTGFVNEAYDSDITGVEIPKYESEDDEAYTPYYYALEVTQDDIDNGYEFVIAKYISNANVYITYIDIGANGTDTPTYIGTIKDIDYTYYTDSNKTGYAIVNTSNEFTLSGVYFNIDGTTTKEVALYVMRSIQSGNLVYYYFVSDGGLTNTVTGSPTKKDSLDDWKSQE